MRFRAAPRVMRLLWVLIPTLLVPSAVLAQTAWEYSPYQVHVWLACRPSVALPEQVQQTILAQLRQEAPIHAGATWQLRAERAPDTLVSTIATRLDTMNVEQVVAVAADVFTCDKLMLLSVEEAEGDFLIACRELDCRARSLGPVVRSRTLQRVRLARDCATAVAAAFSPLVRVEQSRGRSATARVRAGGLVIHDHCVSLVTDGDVLRPVIRRNDRRGDPRPGGIVEVEWTYLLVRATEDYLLQCEVLSAMRNPLAGRTSASVEKLALLVRPCGSGTRLRLLSQGDTDRPLEGYEIFAKKPLPPESEEKNVPVRLGVTDWRGVIDVPSDEWLLRLIYVKNGTHLIARLPVVPGSSPQQTIELPNDDKRLETEAFVKGMESTVMDLVARRAILAARIRRRIQEGKPEDARRLLDELKSFQTKDDLEMMLTSRRQSSLSSSDEREQRRIDQLLSGTRVLLNKYLDPDQLVALAREVEQSSKSPVTPGLQSAAQPAVVPRVPQPAVEQETVSPQ